MEKFEKPAEEFDLNNDEPSIHEIIEPSVLEKGVSPVYEKPVIATNGLKVLSHRDRQRSLRNSGIQEKEPKTLLVPQSTARISQCFTSKGFE
jgi:hypothetical protein